MFNNISTLRHSKNIFIFNKFDLIQNSFLPVNFHFRFTVVVKIRNFKKIDIKNTRKFKKI